MKILEKSGLTLVELIVSMGLMSIFVMVGITNVDTAVRRQKRENFLNSVDQILGTFRVARSDAVSNRLVNGTVPEGGYGVYVQRNSANNTMRLVHFADNNISEGNGVFDDVGDPDGEDMIFEDTLLDTPWRWSFVNTVPSGDPADAFVLIFLPPDADLRLINPFYTSIPILKTEMLFQYSNPNAVSFSTERRICLNRIARFFEVVSSDSSCF